MKHYFLAILLALLCHIPENFGAQEQDILPITITISLEDFEGKHQSPEVVPQNNSEKHSFIRTYPYRSLAFFAAGLMIVFIISKNIDTLAEKLFKACNINHPYPTAEEMGQRNFIKMADLLALTKQESSS